MLSAISDHPLFSNLFVSLQSCVAGIASQTPYAANKIAVNQVLKNLMARGWFKFQFICFG